MSEDLAPDQAHLWCVWPPAVSDPARLDAWEGLLSEDERRQKDRFHFAQGRQEYLLTRSLLRETLSRYADVSPREWRFTRNEHGRPELAGPGAPPLKFSVSHTRGFITCLVALDRDVGVDVENTERRCGLLEIAEGSFSLLEARALQALPSHARRERFFEYWTLKESFTKALGVGIPFGLSRFSFHIEREPIRVFFDAEVPEDADRWQFTLRHPGPHHVLATSVRREPGEDVRVVLHETMFPAE